MADYYDGGPRMSLSHSVIGALVGGAIGAILIGTHAIVSFGVTGAIVGGLLTGDGGGKISPTWAPEKRREASYAYPIWMIAAFPVSLLLVLIGLASVLDIAMAGFSTAWLIGAYMLPAGLTVVYHVICEAEKTIPSEPNDL